MSETPRIINFADPSDLRLDPLPENDGYSTDFGDDTMPLGFLPSFPVEGPPSQLSMHDQGMQLGVDMSLMPVDLSRELTQRVGTSQATLLTELALEKGRGITSDWISVDAETRKFADIAQKVINDRSRTTATELAKVSALNQAVPLAETKLRAAANFQDIRFVEREQTRRQADSVEEGVYDYQVSLQATEKSLVDEHSLRQDYSDNLEKFKVRLQEISTGKTLEGKVRLPISEGEFELYIVDGARYGQLADMLPDTNYDPESPVGLARIKCVLEMRIIPDYDKAIKLVSRRIAELNDGKVRLAQAEQAARLATDEARRTQREVDLSWQASQANTEDRRSEHQNLTGLYGNILSPPQMSIAEEAAARYREQVGREVEQRVIRAAIGQISDSLHGVQLGSLKHEGEQPAIEGAQPATESGQPAVANYSNGEVEPLVSRAEIRRRQRESKRGFLGRLGLARLTERTTVNITSLPRQIKQP